ncbi:hypothetical protein LTR37_015500 [Vermiconidia calcicola]|uniref:Uncharacterized protein n=1 Tax=Vermiconidia calcicola TaxID=1690605 RepID=A0ACC3MS04_9PEZI|nr:hypothetical protein LTR37_015500 [Vermiconidia calcicola]
MRVTTLFAVLAALLYVSVPVTAASHDPLGLDKMSEGKAAVCRAVSEVVEKRSHDEMKTEIASAKALYQSFQPKYGLQLPAYVRAGAIGSGCVEALREVQERSGEYLCHVNVLKKSREDLNGANGDCHRTQSRTKHNYASEIDDARWMNNLLTKNILAEEKYEISKAGIEESLEKWKSVCREEELRRVLPAAAYDEAIRQNIGAIVQEEGQGLDASDENLDASDQETGASKEKIDASVQEVDALEHESEEIVQINADGQEADATERADAGTREREGNLTITAPGPAPSNTTVLPWFSRLWNDHDTWVGYIKQAYRLGRAFRGRIEPGTSGGSNWSGNVSIWIGCLAWCQQDILVDGMLPRTSSPPAIRTRSAGC